MSVKEKISFWKLVPQVTPIFAKVSNVTGRLEIHDYKLIENFFIVLYSRTGKTEDVNSTR